SETGRLEVLRAIAEHAGVGPRHALERVIRIEAAQREHIAERGRDDRRAAVREEPRERPGPEPDGRAVPVEAGALPRNGRDSLRDALFDLRLELAVVVH